MVSNECFGIAIQKQSDTIADICWGQIVTEETRKNFGAVTVRYVMLQEHYASYMSFCLVYENAQNYLLATAECPAMAKKYFGMRSSLFNFFGLLKTERGLAQTMSLQMRKTFQDQIMTWASRAMVLMTSCQKKKEESLSLFDLKGHSRWTMQACIFQMMKLYLD